jgi:uncharacterized protein (DUF885 family)
MTRRLLPAVLACFLARDAIVAQPGTLREFFDDFTAEWIRGNPNQAVATRYFSGEEQQRLERQLTPETATWQEGRRALARRGLTELSRFARAQMTDVDRLSADVMQWQLQTIVDGERHADFNFPFQQFDGVNVGLVNTFTVVHPLLNEADAHNYIARLEQLGSRLDEALVEARRISRKGLIPPGFILRATISQMKQFEGQPAARNPLVTTFADKLAIVKAIPDLRREELRAKVEDIVAAQVYPAWHRAVDFLESLQPQVNDNAGLWRLEGGSQAYAYNLRRFTTTDLSADQIHEIGLKQVARIEAEMDSIFRQLGRDKGSVKERIDQFKKEQAYPLTEEGRAMIMADVERILRDAERRATALFDHRPASPVIAQPFPRFREANAAANYTAPAPDRSRPGIFQIPLRAERMTKFGLRTLVYHETVPGHHFQIALEMENAELPRFRRLRIFSGIPAFSEGWGLYAERLAAESSWYEGDPEGRLGQLADELFRARRLVVDTGLHAKHWTRQQAIDYGIEASEVERYAVYPGQACSYMLGQLKLIELRDKARNALGERFSFKDYHNAVLSMGTVPLKMLEQQIDLYIRSKRNSAG